MTVIDANFRKFLIKIKSLRDLVNGWRDSRDLHPFGRVTVPYSYPNLRFCSPTRALRTEMLKGPDREPETRKWIDEIPSNSVLWDVGANVGSFSIYAAKLGVKVVAVEPMPYNLLLLVRNIALNDVGELCDVLPMALSEVDGPARMNLSSLEFGSAGHGFGTPDFFRGGIRQSAKLCFRLAGVSLATAVEKLKLPAPTHLKVDVDGIDDLVILGAGRYLAGIKGICCEVKLPEERVRALETLLSDNGLQISHRSRRNAFFART